MCWTSLSRLLVGTAAMLRALWPMRALVAHPKQPSLPPPPPPYPADRYVKATHLVTAKGLSLKLRRMIPEDLAAVVIVENCPDQEDAWRRDDFLALLQMRDSYLLGVALAGPRDEVCGYVCLKRQRKTCALVSVCVAPAARRKGVASALIRWGLGHPKCRNYLAVSAMTRVSSLPAQVLLKACGFEAKAQEIPDAYSSPPESAYFFARKAGTNPSPPATPSPPGQEL